MTGVPGETRALAEQAFAALNRRDFRGASELFERAVASGAGEAPVWFGWSVAHRHLGAPLEESRALDEALRRDARYLPALLRKGDVCVEKRDERAACAWYGAAIRLAAGRPSLPAEWQREVQRADAAMREMSARFEAHLRVALAARGFDAGGAAGGYGTSRFGRALDLLLGKRQLYLQEPKYFYFPELPQIQFYDRAQFPWAAGVESATATIREELRAVLAGEEGVEPYIQSVPDRPSFGNPLLNSRDWSAFYLIRDGNEVAPNAQRCPATLRALQEAPLCRIAGRTPSVLFSLLRPGTRIRPHHGFTNARLVCHLPLIVPGNCGLRVGNETHTWREGELVVFDDSMEHEAWNLSAELRVVLLFDIWRPELSAPERTLVAATLEAVGEFDGAQRPWTD